MWICPKCRSENNDFYGQCQKCHTSRPASSSHVQESGAAKERQEWAMNSLLGKVKNGVLFFFIAQILMVISEWMSSKSMSSLLNGDSGKAWSVLSILCSIVAGLLLIYVAWVAIEVLIDWIKTRHQTLNNTRAIREMLEKKEDKT